VDGRIILKWILKKQDIRVWTGFNLTQEICKFELEIGLTEVPSSLVACSKLKSCTWKGATLSMHEMGQRFKN
jgi:hypothetical protein